MRVVVIAVGTRGDVAPYTGLAAALRAAGHQPVIATHGPFQELVEACGAEFRLLPLDMRELLGSREGQRSLRTSGLGAARYTRLLVRHWRAIGDAALAAVTGADLVLVSSMGTTGYHVAEALGIPSAGAFLQPLDPTGRFAPVVLTTRSLGARGNRAAARALRVLGQAQFSAPTNALRRDLGLAPIGPAELFRRMEQQRWPILYGFSPTVVPPPDDWPPGRQVTGYWWPHVPAGWRPPAELTAFLEAGPPPVFVGFGSMAPDRPDLGSTVTTALRRAGVRGVVQAGWAGLGDSGGGGGAGGGGDVLTVGDVPHAWLFPQMAAVVHHAGGGTTGAVLRAGVPGIGVPVAADQPFWADRAARLGTGPPPVAARLLTVDRLAAAVTAATTQPVYRREAQRVAARLAREDGAVAAVAAIERIAEGS